MFASNLQLSISNYHYFWPRSRVGITAPVYLPARDMAECDPEDVLIWNNDKNRFPRKITYVTVYDKLANLYLFDEVQVSPSVCCVLCKEKDGVVYLITTVSLLPCHR